MDTRKTRAAPARHGASRATPATGRTPARPAARSPLNRESIAHAALALIDADGLDALSMRRLGAALGVEAMALYHHFRSKDALLDAVMDRMLDEVELPPGPAPALARLRTTIESYRRLAIAHPHAFVLLASRRFNSERAFAFYEAVLALFQEAGFDPAESARWFRLMGNFAGGSGLADIASRARQRDGTPLPLERLEVGARFPRVAAVAPHLRVANLDAVFAFGLDVIFRAMAAESAERRKSPLPGAAGSRRPGESGAAATAAGSPRRPSRRKLAP